MAGVQTFWINLESSTKRREALMQEFSRIGATNCNRVKAIEPTDLAKYTFIDLSGSKKLLPQEYCCTLSHLKAIHMAYTSGQDAALILEDDARIIRWPAFEDAWTKLQLSAPKSWEILQLFALGKAIESKLIDSKADLWMPWQDGIYSTCAYIINRTGMMKLLKTFLPHQIDCLNWNEYGEVDLTSLDPKNARARFVADWALFDAVETWTFTDILFFEEGEDSTIKPEELALHHSTLQVIADRSSSDAFKIAL